MPFRSLMLTGEQIRAARALARIEQAELAKRCALSIETIKRLERIRGRVDANVRTLNAIVTAFEAIGVYFEGCADGGVGVCRPPVSAEGVRRPPPSRAVDLPDVHGGSGPVQILQRLIYVSTAEDKAKAAMKETLDQIVRSARDRNADLAVTGALLVCNGRFLQVLEGPKDAVRQVYGAISSDPRHSDLVILENRAVATRQFSDWSLCCGLFPSDAAVFAREPAMREGFRPEALTPASALGLLSIVRDLQRHAPRTGRSDAGDCPLAADCLDCMCPASARRDSAA